MNMKAIIAISAIALCALFAACSNAGKTAALIEAARDNDAEETRRLIKARADVNAKDDEGNTALMLAAWKDAADIIALLEAAGAKDF